MDHSEKINSCVLIPHYNNPQGLKLSIQSIGKKEKIDVFVVDDGSSQLFEEHEIKSSFHSTGNIYFIYLEKNFGIAIALNEGLKSILITKRYKFVSRLDCSDKCHPERFSIQKKFLERNEEISLVGSWVNYLDKKGKKIFTIKTPLEHRIIKNKMYYNAMFIHPSIMFKSKILNVTGLYPTKYPAAEDYAFFFKVIKLFKTANLSLTLVDTVIDEKGISYSNRKQQVQSRIAVIIDNFYFGPYPIIGLIRNIILYIIPKEFLEYIKSKIYK